VRLGGRRERVRSLVVWVMLVVSMSEEDTKMRKQAWGKVSLVSGNRGLRGREAEV
jgi:hypothetical protein